MLPSYERNHSTGKNKVTLLPQQPDLSQSNVCILVTILITILCINLPLQTKTYSFVGAGMRSNECTVSSVIIIMSSSFAVTAHHQFYVTN